MKSEQLFENVRYFAARRPEEEAVVCGDDRLTWKQLNDRTDRIAAGLAAEGIGAGDRVGILMHNRIEFVEAMVAILKTGGTIVPLNVRYTASEMIHPVLDARPKIVLSERAFLPILARARAEAPGLTVFVVDEAPGERPFEELRRNDAQGPEVEVSGSDIAFICYTSGTTGEPKGALISHGAVYSGAMAKMLAVGQTYRDRLLMPMPLAFTGGSVGIFRDGIVPGATSVVTNDFDAGTLLELIERERITVTTGVAILFEKMMNHPRFASTDLSSLHHAPAGGSTVTLQLLRTWQARGVQLSQGYGQTESAGCFVTLLFGDEAESRMGSAGRPLPHTEVKLRKGDGSWAEPGEAGEILVRGPSIMSGYLNSPELSEAALRDGWLHTGDVGVMDEDGYLKIVDRTKDMLISGGLNVYPAEIERILGSVPGLDEFAIIGVPDPKWGEVPMLVVPDLSKVDLAILKDFAGRELADYKRPRYATAYGASLPRTLGGKIQKPALRERYRQVPEEAVPLRK